MTIAINITESFGAIDCDNAGGLLSYISITSIEKTVKKLEIEISNFILNLIDEPVITTLKEQAPSFLENITEDGFLIIGSAKVIFDDFKGYEELLRPVSQEQKRILYEAWDGSFIEGDKIYDLAGRLISNPDLLINLAVISPQSVVLEFLSKDCTYIEEYTDFQKIIPVMNLKAKPVLQSQGRLFDVNFSNAHTESNWECGYRVYKDRG
ncbi:hypothetical protein [Pseudomonas capsici]|uniref:hypothetical protein n=1 Tax=Pseudomonas capsici TaxID=2810614 RepID=UPI0021F1C6DF|nr:hypothetical protein [Pseudomonas capsici]MCV4262100.1 hypothetical protein [Pseudomonas capsici]